MTAADPKHSTESSDAYQRCVTLWLELANQTPDDSDVFEGLAYSLNNLAVSEGFRGSLTQQTRLIRQALEFGRAALACASQR